MNSVYMGDEILLWSYPRNYTSPGQEAGHNIVAHVRSPDFFIEEVVYDEVERITG